MAKRMSEPALLLCIGLLTVFSLLSWWSVKGKNATYDEVHHTPSAWAQSRYGDYRVNPQDPPLWHYWAALPHWFDPPAVRTDTRSWHALPEDIMQQWPWAVATLYHTPENDADAFVNRSRAMMLVLGVVLGAVIALWSRHVGGGVAAVAAACAYSFDPNFLAHAPLVKNDVAFTLVFFGFALAVWRLGLKVTWQRALLVGLLCGAGLCVKLSALMFAPLTLLLLLGRALLPTPWDVFGRHLLVCRAKLLTGLVVCITVAIMSYVVVWACYGFRYHPTPDPHVRLNTSRFLQLTAINEILASHPEQSVRQEELDNWTPGPLVRGVLLGEKYRLLPQAWLNGLLYTHMSTRIQSAFLCGSYSSVGWWYYFPLAVLFKTPLASLAGTLLAVALLLLWRQDAQVCKNRLDAWTVLCLAVPFGLYGAFALRTNLNLGLRHVLPLYPFLFMVVGLGASRVWAWARWRKASRLVLAVLAAGLILESLAAFPDYLGFFNTACGGARGGLRLLGDSNLDWGQDLKLLAEWRRKNPSRKLYLCYFGMADPAYYGIDYVNLPGGYRYGPPVQPVTDPGIIAMSATHLQGIHLDPALRNYYAPLRQANPMTVLGSSIYLFDSTLITGVAESMQEQRLLAVSKQPVLHAAANI
ncbi:MAG: hypothetical protein PVJ62_03860 [Deltaproteobacteria bacterium]